MTTGRINVWPTSSQTCEDQLTRLVAERHEIDPEFYRYMADRLLDLRDGWAELERPQGALGGVLTFGVAA